MSDFHLALSSTVILICCCHHVHKFSNNHFIRKEVSNLLHLLYSMNNWTERDFQKKYTGTATLYRDIRLHRTPVLLQRNIRKFIAYNRRKLLNRQQNLVHDSMTSALNGANYAHLNVPERVRTLWNIKDFERNLEDDFLEKDVPQLRIEVKSIKDRREKFLNRSLNGEPIPKRLKTSEIRAQCALTIWDSTTRRKADLVQQTKSCTVRVDRSHMVPQIAAVDMEEAFIVSVNDLLVPKVQGKGNKLHVGEAYTMQISLISVDPTETWPPLPMKIPVPRIAQIDESGEITRFPILSTRWVKLPECPPMGMLLEVIASQDSKIYKTKFGFEIEALWSSSPSPLTIHNAILKKNSSPVPHLPTPTSEAEPTRSIIRVNWSVEGSWTDIEDTSFNEYLCPLCSNLKLENLDEFHFHLIMGHDMFEFRVSCIAEATDTGQQQITTNVKMDIKDRYRSRATSNLLDDREILWEKPKYLFNVESYLKGDQNWDGKLANTNTANGGRLLGLPRVLELSKSGPHDALKSTNFSTATARTAKMVPNLPSANRRKYEVPPAPRGVQYFRSTVKRTLREGEWLTESDDEMDESWLLQKHETTIESFHDVTDQEKEFIKKYDSHMLRENVSSNVHLSEALIRFCRLNRKWLRRKSMKKEFHKNAATLVLHGVLRMLTVRECMQVIEQPGGEDDEAVELDENDDADDDNGRSGRGTEKTLPPRKKPMIGKVASKPSTPSSSRGTKK